MAFVQDSETEEYAVIGYATDTTLTIDADMIETTNPLSGKAKTYKAGRYSWAMEVSRLYTDGTSTADGDSSTVDEVNILKAGTTINVGFSKRGELFDEQTATVANNYKRYYGTALIKSVRINAPVNGPANYSLSLQGTGELTADPDAYMSNRTPSRG